MSGIPASVEIQNEKLDQAHEWLHRNGNNVSGIERKFSPDDAEGEYAARTMTVRRKAKRKEDGPLEIICGWIVQHQIGTIVCPHYTSNNYSLTSNQASLSTS